MTDDRFAGSRDRLRRVGPDFAAGGLYELVVVGTSALTFVVLTRALGPAAFGYYAAIQNLVTVVGSLASGGVSSVLLQRILREDGDPETVMGALLTWTLLGAVGSAALSVALTPALLPGVRIATAVEFVLGQVLGMAMATLATCLVQAVRGFARATLLRLQLQVPQAVVLAVLWGLHDVSLGSVAQWWLVVNSSIAALNLVVASIETGVVIRPRRPRWSDARLGLTYAAVGLCFAVEEDADKVLLIRLGFPAVAGLYAAAYRIVQLGLLPLRTALSATHNRFLSHDPKATGEHRRRSVRFSRPSVLYGAVCSAGLWLTAPVIALVLGHRYVDAVVMIRWLSVLVLLRSGTVFAFNGLMGLGRNSWRLVVLATSAALNLALNVLLIPALSWRGAAVATLAGETAYLLMTWLLLVVFQRRHDRGVLGAASTS